MADVGDDKVVGVHEHPQSSGSHADVDNFKEPEEAEQDEIDTAEIEKVYK